MDKDEIKKFYEDSFGKKILKKIIICTDEEMYEEGFMDATKYFIIDAFGNGVFFRTRSRLTAQEISDELYGKGKYIVKQSMRAAVR